MYIYIYIIYIFIQHFLGIPVRVIHSGIPTRPFVLRRSQMVVLARKLLETMCCTKNWVKAEDLRRSRDGFCWVSSWEHVVARVYSTHIDTHTHIYIYTYNIYIYIHIYIHTYIYIYIYIYTYTWGSISHPIQCRVVQIFYRQQREELTNRWPRLIRRWSWHAMLVASNRRCGWLINDQTGGKPFVKQMGLTLWI